jgi:GAF domain-containing protein
MFSIQQQPGITPSWSKTYPFPKAMMRRSKHGSLWNTRHADLSSLPNLELLKQSNTPIAFATMGYEHEIIGSLTAITLGASRDFSDDELLLLQGLADQAALAITNTRLYKDARRRLEHLQALRAIDIAIASNRDLQETLNIVLDQIAKQLQVDAAVILLLDQTRQKRIRQAVAKHPRCATSLQIGERMAGRRNNAKLSTSVIYE